VGAAGRDFVIDVDHSLRRALLGWLDQCFADMSNESITAMRKPLFLNGLTKVGQQGC
jgi:hypothetical protein